MNIILIQDICVMATTRPMSNSSTSNKSQGQISSGEYELCNSYKNLTGNHNSILPIIYISVLDLCYNFFTPTLMSMPCPHVYYSSASYPITHLLCVYLKSSMPYTCALMSYPKPYSSSLLSMHAPYVHHEETMLLTCSLTLLHLQTLPDPFRPLQTTLGLMM